MIRKLALAVSLLCGLVAGTLPALAQNPSFPSNVGGRVIASEYGNWSITTLTPIVVGANTVNFAPCFVKVGTGNRKIFPFWAKGAQALNVPIQVQDGTNSEAVTSESAATFPAAAPPSYPQETICSFAATFANAHAAGVSITSGDGGLAEAVNDAWSLGVGEVDLDSNFTGTVTSVTPDQAIVSLVDLRANAVAPYWTVQPTTLTALATPATRVAAAACAGKTVCDGTAVGTWTNAATYVCVYYVDLMGQKSPCSATANYTTAGSLAINFTAPVASAGAVGWGANIGITGYSTAYEMPITASNCTLTLFETVIPACAVANTTLGQAASNGVFPTPNVHTAIPGVAGGTAAAYNPNPQSHTTFGYVPSKNRSYGFQQNYGPFTASGALTAGQGVVLGTAPLPAAFLNFITQTLHISGNVTLTPSTGGTIQLLTEIGDITDFTTGTPKAVCTDTETTATGTAAIKVHIDCTWTVNATGTTGTIMPGGFMLEQLQAGTTTGNLAVESATAAITADVLDQDFIYIVFLQTSAAESTTPPQLMDLHIELL